MEKMLYKYTTLEALALILESKKIRLNPLTAMDDLQEAQTDDEIGYGKYVFISSWMDQPSESIAMWKLYSNMNSGVRIGLRRNPFKKYTITKQQLEKVFPGIVMDIDQVESIVPVEECFNDKYMILNYLYDKSLEKVEYTDDPTYLSPKLFCIMEDGVQLKSAGLGKYKNTYWEFQNEERYILRFLPVDVKRITPTTNAAEFVYSAFMSTPVFLPYYDLQISDSAYEAMEITLSPQFSVGNKILLEALHEKFNPNMRVVESALKDSVRL